MTLGVFELAGIDRSLLGKEVTNIASERFAFIKAIDLGLISCNKRMSAIEECHTMCHRHKVANAIANLAGSEFKVLHL